MLEHIRLQPSQKGILSEGQKVLEGVCDGGVRGVRGGMHLCVRASVSVCTCACTTR